MKPGGILSSTIEACPFGAVVFIESLGVIVLANSEVERMFGYGHDELIGQTIDILVPTILREPEGEDSAPISALSQICNVKKRKLTASRKDGGKFQVEIGLNPIRYEGRPLAIAVITDISERTRIECVQRGFITTVSHELRTPLTSIAGALSLMIQNVASTIPAPAARLLTIAYANSQRLVQLVNGIVDMENIESGKVVFAMKRVDIRPMAEAAIEANRVYAEARGVRIRMAHTAVDGEIRSDPDWLLQAIGNLVSNAVKFSPAGEEVVVDITKRDSGIRIEVRDRGCGIPDAFKPRIFEKFAQADSTDTRTQGGAGLGLSIVKQIVTRLGGEVGFDDAPGGGTIFHVDLPASEHNEAPVPEVADAPSVAVQ